MKMNEVPSSRRFPAERVTRALGWFSVGIGVAELLAPRAMARSIGMDGSKGLMQAYGMREIATGIGVLGSRRPGPWLWGRVAGDVLDLATLGTQLGRPGRGRKAALALGAVAAVAALDLACARAQANGAGRRRGAVRDYSDRSGFPHAAEEMRGLARGEARVVHLGLEPERPAGPGSTTL